VARSDRGPGARIPWRIAAVYAVFSVLWIGLSDSVARNLAGGDTRAYQLLSTGKGWVFVAVTATILLFMLRRDVRSVEQYERRLSDSDRRFMLAVGSVDDYAMMMLDASGLVRSWNSGAEILTAVSADDALGRELNTLLASDEAVGGDDLERAIRDARTQGEASVESWRSRRDGTNVFVSLAVTALTDDDGVLSGFLVVAQDRTERLLQGRRLEKASALYAALADVNEAALRGADMETLISLVCDRAATVPGVRRSWVAVGGDGGSPALVACSTPGDRIPGLGVLGQTGDEAVCVPVAEAIESGTTVVYEDVATDPRCEGWRQEPISRGCRTCAVLPVRQGDAVVGALTLCAAEPGFFDEETVGLLGQLAADISFAYEASEAERLRAAAEAELRRLGDVFQQANVGLVVCFPPGEVFDILNPAFARMHGFEVDELIGTPVFDLFPREEAGKVLEALETLLTAGHVTFESVHYRKDRSVFPVLIDIIAIRDDAGEILYRITTMEDITERKRSEAEVEEYRGHLEELVAERTAELTVVNERLVKATKAKDRFLAAMSHELRTPLNSIIGFAGILLQGLAGELNEEQRRQLEIVSDSGKHLLVLINDILDITRIEAGKDIPEPSAFTLAELVGAVEGPMRPLAELKGLDLKIEVADGGTLLNTDRAKAEQILINLVGNAVKFTASGSVRLRAHAEDSKVAVAVADSGVGMGPDERDHAFEEFQQGVHPERGRPEGTGLGLAIASRLATLLGGGITVESVKGAGSTFTLVMPITVPEASTQPDASGSESTQAAADEVSHTGPLDSAGERRATAGG
jgi:PAS domain S-box-containing protein